MPVNCSACNQPFKPYPPPPSQPPLQDRQSLFEEIRSGRKTNPPPPPSHAPPPPPPSQPPPPSHARPPLQPGLLNEINSVKIKSVSSSKPKPKPPSPLNPLDRVTARRRKIASSDDDEEEDDDDKYGDDEPNSTPATPATPATQSKHRRSLGVPKDDMINKFKQAAKAQTALQSTVSEEEQSESDEEWTGGYDRRRAPGTPPTSNKYRFKYHMVKRVLRSLH